MAKQRAPIEINKLSGGIITEANIMSFPDSASIDEDNFELSKVGSRRRRYGITYESLYNLENTGLIYDDARPYAWNHYLWENVGGYKTKSVLVIQYEHKLLFYDASTNSLSDNLEYTLNMSTSLGTSSWDFTNINGNLIVVTGNRDIYTLSPVFNDGGEIKAITTTTSYLTIRDLFGVTVQYNIAVESDDYSAGDYSYIDLSDPVYATKRPIPTGLTSSSGGGTTSVNVTSGDITGTFEYFPIMTADGLTGATSFLGNNIAVIRYAYDYNEMVIDFEDDTTFSNLILHIILGSTDYSYTMWQDSSKVWNAKIPTSIEDSVKAAAIAETLIMRLETTTTSTEGIVYSPTKYIYNLRNQTFANRRLGKTGTVKYDPISDFVSNEDDSKYPSMGDSVIYSLYANTADDDNKTVNRFHSQDLIDNQQGSYQAPKGYFIIDALNRSTSREEVWQTLVDDQNYPASEVVDLDTDITLGGATCICEYGGRLWYGGFSEEGGTFSVDSTRLDSYLLYSQASSSTATITRCYQEGDPTSIDEPDIVDTDGGFLSLDGAYGVHRLVTLGNSLLVFATNGVWAISGTDGNYFTPTSQRVSKVTERGSIAPKGIVVVNNSVLYWAKDGIYHITVTSAETYEVKNLTELTIQSLMNEIDYTYKVEVVGAYDSYESQVVWMVNNTTDRDSNTFALKLLMTTGAFTRHTIYDGDSTRTVLGPVETPAFTLGDYEEPVYDNEGNKVYDNDNELVVTVSTEIDSTQAETKYVILEDVDNYSNITFGSFTQPDWKDWGEVDAAAYMVTGYVSGGDYQRYKQAPYITFHMERTEDGFEVNEDDDWVPTHPSSCLMQVQWDWANSAASGRWSRETQVYRYRRHYMPSSIDDYYDSGTATITTKNKVRGKGRVLSIKMSTEEGKDCRILGWSAIMNVNGEV